MSSEPSSRSNGSPALVVLAKILLHFVLPVAVLVGAYFGARYLLATAPTTEKKPRGRSARTVEVVEVNGTTKAPRIEAMGLVRPAREVTLRPRVSGEVSSIAAHFEPGGRFAEGDELLLIDPADFDLALDHHRAGVEQAETAEAQAKTALAQARAMLDQRRAALEEARANLRLEEGNQAIARREYEMLDGAREGANPGLVLRTPQLAIAKANVASAEAGIEAAVAGAEAASAGIEAAAANVRVAEVRLRQAKLDKTRTSLKAPFNAWIRERFVEVGAVIGTTTNVATLVGADDYWVEVTLPVSDLKWLHLPDGTNGPAPQVVIRDDAAWGPEGMRTGTLLRLLGDLESSGRLARLLVVVTDPLHLQTELSARRPLLLGAYVRVELEGRAVTDAVELDRRWLRHGDIVWIVDAEGKLRIREVEVRWRGRNRVFVAEGLEVGDRVVTTDLGAPVDGMPVLVHGDTPERGRP